MNLQKEPPIVISIGGSQIVPNGGINIDFLSKLNVFVRKHVAKGRKFFLVTGGGNTARHYIDAGKNIVGGMTNEDLDWLGIHGSRLNAHLIRTIFKDIAHPRIIMDYKRPLIDRKEPVVVGAGWKPGWSTDYCAAALARDYKAYVLLNISNVSYVYDKNPHKFKDAKKITKLSWLEMEKLVGDKWTPGLNTPFDPIATKLAKDNHLTVVVANAKDFSNLDKIINGDSFKGTIIMPFTIDNSFYDREYYVGKKGENRLIYSESCIGKFSHKILNYYRALLIKMAFKPKKVLDVGCATGGLVKALRFLGIDAYGVEVSKYALKYADKDIKAYLKKGDIINLPYKDNEFDLVLTYDVMEHLERSKLKKALEETIRVSNKYIFHKIYTRENFWITLFHHRDFSHISFFTKHHWKQIFLSLKNVKILPLIFIKLPSFFETVFILRKKS